MNIEINLPDDFSPEEAREFERTWRKVFEQAEEWDDPVPLTEIMQEIARRADLRWDPYTPILEPRFTRHEDECEECGEPRKLSSGEAQANEGNDR